MYGSERPIRKEPACGFFRLVDMLKLSQVEGRRHWRQVSELMGDPFMADVPFGFKLELKGLPSHEQVKATASPAE